MLSAGAWAAGEEAAPATAAPAETAVAPPEPEASLTFDMGGGVMLDLVLVKPGTFQMGSEAGISDERPVGNVTIKEPFYLGKFEVTQRQWQAVVSLDPMETMARGVVARMKQAQFGQAGPVPVKAIETFVSEQWKAVVGDVSKISPPVVVMSKAVEAQWNSDMASGFESLQTEAIARTLADHWKAMGIKTLARAIGEELGKVMGPDPRAVNLDMVNRILAEQWAPTMGSDPVDMMAKGVLEKVKAAMGASKLPIATKKAASIVAEEWKSVMDADPYASVPLDEIANVVAEHWKKAADKAAANIVAHETLQKAASAQWKSGISKEGLDKKADAVVEQLTATLAVRPDPALVDKTKKALAKKWQSIIDDEKQKDTKKPALLIKAVGDQWAATMTAPAVEEYAAEVAARWKAIPGADPAGEMAKVFLEEWKASSGSNREAVPLEKIENTVAERWKSIVGSDPIVKVAKMVSGEWKTMPAGNSRFDGADLPMDTLNWRDAQEFAQRLSCLLPGNEFRLPTEAEWEYACRAGTTTEYNFGDTAANLGDFAWFAENSNRMSHPVGEKKPNAWGFHDMYGNLLEWCLSPYISYPFQEGDGGKDARILPHVTRGGWWGSNAEDCRSASRLGYASSNRHYSFGCRIALTVK